MNGWLSRLGRKIGSLGGHDLYEEGIDLYNQGLYREALSRFVRVLGEGASKRSLHCSLASFYSGQAHLNLGILALYGGDYASAAEHLEASSKFNPNQFGTYHYLGMVYNNLGRYAEALEAFNKVLELNPDYLPVKTKLALVFFNEARYDKARQELERVVVRNPEWADMRYHLGLVYASLGRLEEGLAQLRAAVEINPGYLKARISLGVLLGLSGRAEEGVEVLQTLAQERPKFPDIHYHLGLLLAGQGRLAEAKTSLERALEVNPKYALALFGLGVILGAQGLPQAAEEKFNAVLTLRPGHPESEFVLHHIQRLRVENQAQACQDFLLEFWKQTSADPARRVVIVPDFSDIITIFNPTHDRALYLSLIRLFQASAERHPNFADLHEALGVLYSQLQIYDKAIDSLRRALAANPNYIRARINLFRVYLALGMDQEAVAEIEVLIQRGLSFPDLFLDQARALSRLGREEEAVKSLGLALNLNPDLESAIRLWVQIEERQRRPAQAAAVLEGYLTRLDHPGPLDLVDKLAELKKVG